MKTLEFEKEVIGQILSVENLFQRHNLFCEIKKKEFLTENEYSEPFGSDEDACIVYRISIPNSGMTIIVLNDVAEYVKGSLFDRLNESTMEIKVACLREMGIQGSFPALKEMAEKMEFSFRSVALINDGICNPYEITEKLFNAEGGIVLTAEDRTFRNNVTALVLGEDTILPAVHDYFVERGYEGGFLIFPMGTEQMMFLPKVPTEKGFYRTLEDYYGILWEMNEDLRSYGKEVVFEQLFYYDGKTCRKAEGEV